MRPIETSLKILTWSDSLHHKRDMIKAKEKRFYEINVWLMKHNYNHAEWDKMSLEYMRIPGEIDILQKQILDIRYQSHTQHTKYYADNLAHL